MIAIVLICYDAVVRDGWRRDLSVGHAKGHLQISDFPGNDYQRLIRNYYRIPLSNIKFKIHHYPKDHHQNVRKPKTEACEWIPLNLCYTKQHFLGLRKTSSWLRLNWPHCFATKLCQVGISVFQSFATHWNPGSRSQAEQNSVQRKLNPLKQKQVARSAGILTLLAVSGCCLYFEWMDVNGMKI